MTWISVEISCGPPVIVLQFVPIKGIGRSERVRGMIYLNNAAHGWPPAPGVREAIQAALSEPPEDAGRAASALEDHRSRARRAVCALLGGKHPFRVVFTHNATYALNVAIRGLALPRGSLVITSVTEHNSVLRPLYRLREERGIRLSIVGLDSVGAIDEEAFRKALAEGPGLVALNHASNVTGRVIDVGPLFRAAKDAGALTLLDASQAVGWMPVDVGELRADLIAFAGHKGLHGPAGTGCLYVAPGLHLEPLVAGGTGSRSDLERHPEEMPARLEAGTPNSAALAGLAAALIWHEKRAAGSFQVLAQRRERLWAGLQRRAGVQLFDRQGSGESTGTLSFRIDGWEVEEAGFVLRESFGIVCRSGLHCAPLIHAALGSAPSGTIRFSVSPFTTEEEIDAAVEAVAQLSRCAP